MLARFVLWLGEMLLFIAWYPLREYTGIEAYPFFIFSVATTPLRYYIYMKDSQYWTSVSFDMDNRLESMDPLNVPLCRNLAFEMASIRQQPSLMAARPLVLPWHDITIGEEIDRGSFGQVYIGNLASSTEIKAIKRQSADALDADEIRQLCFEVMLSWHLAESSALVVQTDGFCLRPPDVYLVMKYYNCGDLRQVLQHGDLEYPARLALAEQTVNAVKHTHRLGFVHR